MSQEDQKNFCSKNFSDLGFSQSDFIVTKNVFKDGLDVVSQCLKLAGDGWDIKYKQFQNAVSINISFRGAGGDFKGLDIIPENSAQCRDVPKLPARVLSDGVSFICERKPRVDSTGDVRVTIADESIINVRLGDGIFSVVLGAYSNSIVNTKEKEVSDLKDSLNNASQELARLRLRDAIMKKTIRDALGQLPGLKQSLTAGYDFAGAAKSNSSDVSTCSLRASQSMQNLDNAKNTNAVITQILTSGSESVQ